MTLDELRRSDFTAEDCQVLLYIARRLASGARLTPPKDGITTPTEACENAVDLAVDRVRQLLLHGPDAPVSPSRIGLPPKGGRS